VFDLSPEKIIFLGLIAMLVLGPQRLPEFARKAGKTLADLRRLSAGLQEEVRGALVEPRQALGDAVEELGLPKVPSVPHLPDVRRSITDALTGPVPPRSAPSLPAASTPTFPSVDPGGAPPVPDDPTLN
jgi:sec-independent protein translocase protein TatB